MAHGMGRISARISAKYCIDRTGLKDRFGLCTDTFLLLPEFLTKEHSPSPLTIFKLWRVAKLKGYSVVDWLYWS